MKKITVFIILCILTTGGGASYLTHRHFSETPPRSTTVESKLGLKTYTSNGGDYSVDYPEEWKRTFIPLSSLDGDFLQGSWFKDPITDEIIASITMSIPGPVGASVLAGTNADKQVTIAGWQGYYFESSKTYAVVADGTLFRISFENTPSNQELFPKFEQMVKSFRLNN